MKLLNFTLKTIIFLVLIYLLVLYNNNLMAKEASTLIYSDIEKIPSKKAVLVLGTSKYLRGGQTNYFYTYRIDATVKLFKAGK
ncbi:MAG: hypothetical protein DSZ11_00520, partial [Sulfurovum sp.]